MALIASISGIRGTIGGKSGDNLTPVDVVQFTSAFGVWLGTKSESRRVVVGRDARRSGPMIEKIVVGTLMGLGFEVINLGLSTTPTVELAVTHFEAAGGIVITASHNPQQWNALKLLNRMGEFVTQKGGSEILEIHHRGNFHFNSVEQTGSEVKEENFTLIHIEKILSHPLVDNFAISKSGLRVLVDGVNSSGGLYVPQLLRALGLTDIVLLNCEPSGQFAHNPEPLKENLIETCAKVKECGAQLGIVVDPDVDRLVFIDENGELFGEEYTLVAVADYVLQHKKGSVVSNLSSSRALRDLAESFGCTYFASAVGEVNVTEKMKRYDAVIGGEGNGGVILPDLHYGRDALIGIGLFLSHLVKSKLSASALRRKYPDYFMSKQKVELTPGLDPAAVLAAVKAAHAHEQFNEVDGLKIDFAESWVHLRRSNTEPIIRIYSEAKTQQAADELATAFKKEILKLAPQSDSNRIQA